MYPFPRMSADEAAELIHDGDLVAFSGFTPAGAAKAKQMEVVRPRVLIAGYMAVWLAFALVASLVQGALAAAGALSSDMHLVHPALGALVLIGAGAWLLDAKPNRKPKHNARRPSLLPRQPARLF